MKDRCDVTDNEDHDCCRPGRAGSHTQSGIVCLNSEGPSSEPWGTPESSGNGCDVMD